MWKGGCKQLFCHATGLDSYAALVLVQHMRELAAQQRTIIASIHQPRMAIWDMFNKVEVLSEGHLLYFGPTTKVILAKPL